jgi:hypothetical protein
LPTRPRFFLLGVINPSVAGLVIVGLATTAGSFAMQPLAPIRNVMPSRYVTNFGGLVPRLLGRSDLRLLLGGQQRQLLGLAGVLHVVRRWLDLARHEAGNPLGP